ncbi:MAG: hypothetical protein IKA23_07800 [Akkermansia sp.]|nr:hypothetical protein [Akkermansia sp.]
MEFISCPFFLFGSRHRFPHGRILAVSRTTFAILWEYRPIFIRAEQHEWGLLVVSHLLDQQVVETVATAFTDDDFDGIILACLYTDGSAAGQPAERIIEETGVSAAFSSPVHT